MAYPYIPFEYRALLLINLGLWCWGLNLQLLTKAGIDASALFGYEKRRRKVHGVIYKIALVFSLITFGFLVLFWCAERFFYKGELVTGVCYLVLFFLTVCPFNILYKQVRYSFLRSLLRIAFSPIRSETLFGDIILADILTSFAKVVVGIYFALCAFFTSLNPNTLTSDYTHYSLELLVIAPFFTSLPFLFRFRQCISEYLASKGTGHRPLANAIKYASAFPVIFLSASMHSQSREDSHILTIWLLAVIFNSLYSFYWDVVIDWGLSISFASEKKSGMLTLRHILLYPESVYYISILLDFFLRTTWSLKLSERWRSDDLVVAGFLLEAVEILRRWLWVYFRVEKEWIGFVFNGYSSQPFEPPECGTEQELNLIAHEQFPIQPT